MMYCVADLEYANGAMLTDTAQRAWSFGCAKLLWHSHGVGALSGKHWPVPSDCTAVLLSSSRQLMFDRIL